MISAKTEKEAPCTKDPKEIEAKPSENMESAPKTIVEDKNHKDPKEIEAKPSENMESAPKPIVEDKKHKDPKEIEIKPAENVESAPKTIVEDKNHKNPKEIEANPAENMESAPKTIVEDKNHKDPKEIEVKPAENMECAPKAIVEDKKHMEQMLAVSTIPLRLDHQIQSIKTIQQELLKLHLKQVMLLDGCTELLHELNAVQPTNEDEELKVLETFREVKSKLSGVFEHYLPAQLSILKQESKISQMSAEIVPK